MPQKINSGSSHGSSQVQFLLAAGLCLLLALVSLYTRPLWPIDETRYVSVAWEMWARGDFLVPYLNGEPYSHKPPLLFWLFQLGWWVFGVNEWWPRLVPALCAVGNLFLVVRLARLLWPTQEKLARYTPLLLLGCLLWTAFVAITLFDMLLSFIVLLGMLGTLHVWRYSGIRGWLLLGLAIGLGMLAKGPVILLHTLPVAALAPWWAVENRPLSWVRWYGGILAALLLGSAIGLCWAIPASISGGSVYRDAILWGQTADRMVHSFAHLEPWWWYLPRLPLLIFPWLLWPPLWRGIRRLWADSRNGARDSGVRFCLAWLVPVFMGFSLISGKQEHYLLPLLPALALLMSYILFTVPTEVRRMDALLPALSFIAIGIVLLLAPYLAPRYPGLPWVSQIPPLAGTALVLCGVMLVAVVPKNVTHGLTALMLSSVLLVVMVEWGVVRVIAPSYDLKVIAEHINSLQQSGHRIAHVEKYFGQFHFSGRLQQPLDVIDRKDVSAWIARYPDGLVISYSDSWRPDGNGKPEYTSPYRSISLMLWARDAILLDSK